MKEEKRTVICGTGHYLPPQIVTNFDLEKIINTSDEWIRQRTGIVQRHYGTPGVGSSDLATEAAKLAIKDAGIDKSEIDFIIAATLSPDYYFPGIGVLVGSKLGLNGIGALDVRNQCSGFIYALSVADQYIRNGTYQKILLVAAEVQSSNLDHSDEGRDMAVLFGDGAGAVILEANSENDGRGILTTKLFSDGQYACELWMEKPSPKDKPTFSPGLLEEKKYYRYFYSEDSSRSGVIAGIAVNYLFDDKKPLVSLVRHKDELHVSSRGNQRLVEEGLNLGLAMRELAMKLDGHGGGHKIAAGATIPLDKEEFFLEELDNILKKQIG